MRTACVDKRHSLEIAVYNKKKLFQTNNAVRFLTLKLYLKSICINLNIQSLLKIQHLIKIACLVEYLISFICCIFACVCNYKVYYLFQRFEEAKKPILWTRIPLKLLRMVEI